MFNIVLVQPEIPANAGNIARSCAVTGSNLHLIRPLGFSVDDKYLKRAGLDYWDLLDVQIYNCLEEFMEMCLPTTSQFYMITTKGRHFYTEKKFVKGDYFFFGSETRGLPKELLEDYQEQCLKIPMYKDKKARSLNLANSVSIVLYRALSQHNFPGFV